MPRININEIDSSRYVNPAESAPMTVLVPGTASFGPVFTSDNPEVFTFVGDDDLINFYNTFGVNPAKYADTNKVLRTLSGDLSFEYVTNLLHSGATVQFYRLNSGKAATGGSSANSALISAKYSGRFGNMLIVDVQSVKLTSSTTSKTDAIISVYRNTFEATDILVPSNNVDLIKKLPRLISTRVSIDENSQYYIDSVDLKYVDITVENLTALIGTGNATYNLFGGLDYAADGQAIDEETSFSAVIEALKASYTNFSDQYLFDFDIVSAGGITPEKDELEKVNEEITKLCETRKDCFAPLDTPMDASYTEVLTYASTQESSYTAIYAPWCSFVSSTTGRTVTMPPSFIFMKALLLGMESQVDAELWYVPAGVQRTSAPFIVAPTYQIGSTILDEFQNNNEYRVNPIMRLRNYGYCIYGNATCKQSITGVPHSALESLNVRLIANAVKKHIFEVCSGLSFDYNNSQLWLSFYSQMDEKLLYMKRHYGLYDYKIIMDASTVTTEAMNERRVPGKVLISPTLAGEFFDIDFEIVPSGVTFTTEEEA